MQWRVETFSCLGSFNMQELANSVFALATWGEAPSDVWLARWAQVMRQRWGTRGACTPPAMVRALYSLAVLPPVIPVPATLMLAQRAAATAAAAAAAVAAADGQVQGRERHEHDDHHQQQQQQQWSGQHGGSSQASVERLPSFNWMCGFLGAARLTVDGLRPGELATLLWALARLGHAPDLIFMDCWYRAAASRMRSFGPAELALAVHALGALHPGQGVPGALPGRFVRELLPQSRRLLPSCSGFQLSQVLWGLAELRLWPGQLWLEDWLAGEWFDRIRSRAMQLNFGNTVGL